MIRKPEDCPHRIPVVADAGGLRHSCRLVRDAMGLSTDGECQVDQTTCEACCRTLAGHHELNPVVASVIYGIASQIIRDGGNDSCSAQAATQVQRRVQDHLEFELAAIPSQSFPPQFSSHAAGASQSSPAKREWAIGLLTAPRPVSTIERTLISLEQARLSPDLILAEPGSFLPDGASHKTIVSNPSRLGIYCNFYVALAMLWERFPAAECFGIFQDDIELAEDLRSWCDREFWPLDAGIVSLFTPRIHAADNPGWRLCFPGFHRVYGGQALVFRRDILEGFLADPQVVGDLWRRQKNVDAIVSAWASRRRIGIAYHTPSLAQHIGEKSSHRRGSPDRRIVADAVRSIGRLDQWTPPRRHPARIALVGYNAPTGLGYQNRDIAANLPIDRWLIADCPYAPELEPPTVPWHRVSRNSSERELARMLADVDWLLFAEQPIPRRVVSMARRLGISVACIPNWEQLSPEAPWLAYVDLMICPTRHTYAHIVDWKQRFNFGWDIIHVPWPIDAGKFSFQLRRVCRRFVFVGGWLGLRARDVHGNPRPYTRKGLEVMIEAATLAPQLSFVVHSQRALGQIKLPSNIEVLGPSADRSSLYSIGDVCVQPSHWEGIGMQLMECQAAGIPLITTAAPPMNEHHHLASIPVRRQEVVVLNNGSAFSSNMIDATDLVKTLESVHGSDISDASFAARNYAETQRNWSKAREAILPHLISHRL